MTFIPIYLYIKRHSITGKLYFGKTYKDPVLYSGSGKHWKSHLKVHGKEHVETLWYCLFYDQEELTKFALMCSELWDIVNSADWLNFIPENGLDGGAPGSKLSSETREKIGLRLKGKSKSTEHKEKIAESIKSLSPSIFEKIAASNRGRIHSDETRSNMSIAHKGKKKSDEQRLKMTEAKDVCPHCGKTCHRITLIRHHLNNCKSLEKQNVTIS